MATFFGEVLSVHSRAVEEYDEEEENEEDEDIYKELEGNREVQLEWYPAESDRTPSHLMQCTNLIIAVGNNAASFLSVYVLTSETWEAVGQASFSKERSKVIGAQSSSEPACVFYRNKDAPAVFICKVTGYVEEDMQFQWTEKVFGCFQQRGLSVTVLSQCPLAEYKTPDAHCSLLAPFLLCLQTNVSNRKPPCPLLEQPNIFTGIPAAVLSHCQVNQIPAVAYQCYSDAIGPDSITMETYKQAFTSLGEAVKVGSLPIVDVLHKIVQTNQIQSNLYI